MEDGIRTQTRPQTAEPVARPDAKRTPDAARLDSTGRSADFFRSVDSAPKAVSVARPRMVQDTALVAFAFISIIVLALPELARTGVLDLAIPRDYVIFSADRVNSMLPVRSFILAFFLTYALFAYGSVVTRGRLALLFLAKFVAACAIIDGGAWLSWRFVDAVWPIHFQQFLAGMAGLVIFPHTLISNARLPVDSGVPICAPARCMSTPSCSSPR